MAEVKKKAKLAHEKGMRTQPQDGQGNDFGVREVLAIVKFDEQPYVVAVLDADGTKGLVSPLFASTGRDGKLHPACLACPATYDSAARLRATELFTRWAQQQRASLARL